MPLWQLPGGKQRPRLRDGYLEPPDAPGIGVELDEAEMARHPCGGAPGPRVGQDGILSNIGFVGTLAACVGQDGILSNISCGGTHRLRVGQDGILSNIHCGGAPGSRVGQDAILSNISFRDWGGCNHDSVTGDSRYPGG